MEELIYDNMTGLIADAIGDATKNDEEDIRKQIEGGKMKELISKIQDVMVSYGVKNEDIYADSTVQAIKDRLQWMVEHPYKGATDEQIKNTVDKLVWNITRPFKGGQIVAAHK